MPAKFIQTLANCYQQIKEFLIPKIRLLETQDSLNARIWVYASNEFIDMLKQVLQYSKSASASVVILSVPSAKELKVRMPLLKSFKPF